MKRWTLLIACLVLGLLLLACGWLMPAYLRAVDAGVIQKAGKNSPVLLIDTGLAFVRKDHLGTARMFLRAAQAQGLTGREKLAVATDGLANTHPGWQALGGEEPRLEKVFGLSPPGVESQPFTDFVLRPENRENALAFLSASPQAGAQELLRCRALTNTVLFSPSQSASGQAFDAALSVCGLLLEEGRLTPALSKDVFTLAAEANRDGRSPRFEQLLLDFMSLGQRFDWDQLAVFAGHIEDAETLRLLTTFLRQANGREPVLFTVVVMSGKPSAVTAYLGNFSQTGLKDLGGALRFGEGGLKELLVRNQRLQATRPGLADYVPFSLFYNFAVDLSWRTPGFAIILKWFFYLAAGFLLAMALHFARPVAPVLERPLQVRGFHLARELLFALGFLMVALIVSEPFLASDSQKVALPFRLHLPMVGGAGPAGIFGDRSSFMSQANVLTMLLFFALQALLYAACLVKLAEIRRQRVIPRIKLKLLENEDHLFDAGLYLGFLGTIVSFVLTSLGVHFSLMVAYSSTSFGILFVSFFKIFNLRPVRRRLLLEAEYQPAETEAAPSLAQTV